MCAAGSRLEGAVILWLSAKWKLKKYPHPWRRTYNTKRRAKFVFSYRAYTVLLIILHFPPCLHLTSHLPIILHLPPCLHLTSHLPIILHLPPCLHLTSHLPIILHLPPCLHLTSHLPQYLYFLSTCCVRDVTSGCVLTSWQSPAVLCSGGRSTIDTAAR